MFSNSSSCDVFIIAEIGNNHDGSKERAIELIDIAADCGADAVKFQTFRGTDIVSPLIKSSEYPQWDVGNYEYWYQFLDSIALPFDAHKPVFDYAKSRGLAVFSTPTSPEIVDFLESIGVPAYKIASMDVTNIPLLQRVAATCKPVIISTGMASDSELDKLMSFFPASDVSLLHCISDYPLDPCNANLLSINHLKERYLSTNRIGFSDHSLDSFLSCLAVAMGARIIEKHITYDRFSNSPAEHHFSLDPNMFQAFVADIRKTQSSLGITALSRSPSENANRSKYRRSIHVNKQLPAGAILSSDDLAIVRPGDGAEPEFLLDFLGSRLVIEKKPWEPLVISDISSSNFLYE